MILHYYKKYRKLHPLFFGTVQTFIYLYGKISTITNLCRSNDSIDDCNILYFRQTITLYIK